MSENIRPVGQRTDVTTTRFVSPMDQIRWGPILAGLFTAASCMIVLSVLGLAIGMSAYDPGDSARAFGIGAGWWGGLSALISFFIGGWIAARGAALRNSRSALMNGAMVWAVAIPFMLYFLGTAVAGATSTVAQTGAAMHRDVQQQTQGQTDNPLDQARAAAGRPVSAFIHGVDEVGLRRAARAFDVKSEFVLSAEQNKGKEFAQRLRSHLRRGNPAILLSRHFEHWVATIGYLAKQRKFIIVDPKEKYAVFFRWSEARLLRNAWNVASGVGCYGLPDDPSVAPGGFRIGEKLVDDHHESAHYQAQQHWNDKPLAPAGPLAVD